MHQPFANRTLSALMMELAMLVDLAHLKMLELFMATIAGV